MILLDTHVLLWAATEASRLRASARAALEDGENEVLVSAVVGWEIAIKQSLGKLTLASPAEVWLPDVIRQLNGAGIEVQSVEVREPDLEAVFLALTGRALRD